MDTTAPRSRPAIAPLGLRAWLALVLVNALLILGMVTIWHELTGGFVIWLVWVVLSLYMLTMAVWEVVLRVRGRQSA